MSRKRVSATTIIGGSDGPTSIFLVGNKGGKLSLRQKLKRVCYKVRKKRAEKSIKADAHTMDQVCEYIVNELGYIEVDKSESRYKEEYREMRASFLMQYKPELLGELAEIPKLEKHDEESLRHFFEQLEMRKKAAESISTDLFDIDLHIFAKMTNNLESSFTIEKNYELISSSSSGSKREMKKFEKLFRKVYMYYGVTQKDIDEYTRRYEELVRVLAINH